jgi:hypothetical protein
MVVSLSSTDGDTAGLGVNCEEPGGKFFTIWHNSPYI